MDSEIYVGYLVNAAKRARSYFFIELIMVINIGYLFEGADLTYCKFVIKLSIVYSDETSFIRTYRFHFRPFDLLFFIFSIILRFWWPGWTVAAWWAIFTLQIFYKSTLRIYWLNFANFFLLTFRLFDVGTDAARKSH